ncbi:MAG: S41 family peptidase [Petrimonas sp.]|uniref:S41 family peptidase n=1 Tax=Petrimonas sp. TaxID=2023866 RepID=UPI002B3F170E|nr:S41 family peptidase [Petrimonas sp.]
MKKLFELFSLSLVLISFTVLNTSCNKEERSENPNEYVNNWIYEKMTTFYYWNDKIPSNPNYTLASSDFFKSLIYTFDKNTNPNGDRFSVIRENYLDLLNSLGGVSSDEIGFEYVPVNISPKEATTKQYYLLVLYPKLDTDAYRKGVKRGRFIVKIDNQDITNNNYKTLISGTGSKTLTFADWVYNEKTKEYELKLSANTITIQMHKNFAEKPVYLDSVYSINNKKIGYLVYNFFATDKGDGSHEYDIELMDALQRIKSKGATEFILDLRYNGGGAVSTAIALASALVKNRSTQNLLISTEYNPLVHSVFKKEYGEGYNKEYFIDKIIDVKYDNNGKEISRSDVVTIPSLNLPRLYVLVSEWTASASELIINGLKPYMNVILIGETTVGKNVGSFAIYEESDPKNKWGMLPITFKYFNSAGKSDFAAGFSPDYEISEWEDLILKEFGDKEELFLNKALSLITGTTLKSATRIVKANTDLKAVKSSQSMKITEMYDDKRQEVIRNIMNK